MSEEQQDQAYTAEESWPSVAKGVLFGFDFFISYAQSPGTNAYASRLQETLIKRDYVCFRDTSHLKAGEPLTLKIRLGLKKTRCLIVLGSNKALESQWVGKEIGLFSGKERPIIPIDLEEIRGRHSWAPLNDVLFINDSGPLPSSKTIDGIVSRFRGRRANVLARWFFSLAILVLLAVATGLTIQALALKERSERLRNQALVSMAQSLPDPLTGSLVLLEGDPEKLPDHAEDIAAALCRAPIPSAVLRAANSDVEWLAFIDEGRQVVAVDDDGDVRVWPSSGRGDARVAGKLFAHADRYGLTGSSNAVFAVGTTGMSLLFMDGRTSQIQLPAEPVPDESGEIVKDEIPGTESTDDAPASAEEDPGEDSAVERWTVAHRATGWRVSDDGSYVALLGDSGSVAFYSTDKANAEQVATLQLAGTAALDLTIEGTKDIFKLRGTILTTAGSLLEYALPSDSPTRVLQEKIEGLAPDETPSLGKLPDVTAFCPANMRLVVGVDGESWKLRKLVRSGLKRGEKPAVFEPGEMIDSWRLSKGGDHMAVSLSSGQVLLVSLATMQASAPPASTRIPRKEINAGDVWKREEESGDPQEKEMTGFANPEISASGRYVTLVSQDQAWIWKPDAKGTAMPLSADLYFEEKCRACFSQDESLVAVADASGDIRIWSLDLQDRSPVSLSLGERAYSFGFHPAGSLLAASVDGSVVYSQIGAQVKSRQIDSGSKGSISCAINPAGTTGAAMFSDGTVRIFELPSGKKSHEFLFDPGISEGPFYPQAAFQDNDVLLLAGRNRLATWSAAAGLRSGKPGKVGARVKIGQRSSFATIASEGEIIVSSIPDQDTIHRCQVAGKIWGFGTSESGNQVVAGTEGGRMHYWDFNSGSNWYFDVPGNPMIMSAALSPDGGQLAVGTADGRVGIKKTKRNAPVQWLVSPDLRQASKSSESMLAHLGVVADLRFSPDSSVLTSAGGMDGSCRVWNREGAHLGRLYLGGVSIQIGFLDDQRIVTLNENGKISIWSVGKKALLQHLRSRTTAVLLPSERMKYLGESMDVARERYAESERYYGRTPLPDTHWEIDFKY